MNPKPMTDEEIKQAVVGRLIEALAEVRAYNERGGMSFGLLSVEIADVEQVLALLSAKTEENRRLREAAQAVSEDASPNSDGALLANDAVVDGALILALRQALQEGFRQTDGSSSSESAAQRTAAPAPRQDGVKLDGGERHELLCLRHRVKQLDYPCSPHCDGYLREQALQNTRWTGVTLRTEQVAGGVGAHLIVDAERADGSSVEIIRDYADIQDSIISHWARLPAESGGPVSTEPKAKECSAELDEPPLPARGSEPE